MAITSDNMNQALAPTLAAQLERGQGGHAYLLSGAGAYAQGRLLAMALMCEQPLAGQPCGRCLSCRTVADGNHADVTVIEPDHHKIKIDQLKKMQAAANLEAYSGGRKIFIIEGADGMTDEAANSLLKILEEPPAETIFILCAAKTQGILPTILSRCQRFGCGGEGNLALDEQAVAELLPQAERFLLSLPDLPLAQIMLFSQEWHKEKAGFGNLLSALLQLLHRNVREGYGPYTPAVALTAALFCERALDQLDHNINQRLLCDVFFLRLWRWAN